MLVSYIKKFLEFPSVLQFQVSTSELNCQKSPKWPEAHPSPYGLSIARAAQAIPSPLSYVSLSLPHFRSTSLPPSKNNQSVRVITFLGHQSISFIWKISRFGDNRHFSMFQIVSSFQMSVFMWKVEYSFWKFTDSVAKWEKLRNVFFVNSFFV